jgi:hypothetical protein
LESLVHWNMYPNHLTVHHQRCNNNNKGVLSELNCISMSTNASVASYGPHYEANLRPIQVPMTGHIGINWV